MGTKKLISKSKKVSTINGMGYGETINQYVFRTDKPFFHVGQGTLSKTMTKHMTEPESEIYLKTLP